MQYCGDCANKGILLDGSVCHCRVNVQSYYDRVDCLDIPEQYRNIPFNKLMLPKDLNVAYGRFLEDTHNKILQRQYKYCNLIVCSPTNHGKTIWAYSILEGLFRAGIPTFPLMDVLELKRILIDMDLSRKQMYEVDKPERMFTVPYLICKIPRIPTWEVYDTVLTLIDRRTRRDNSTIFLFEGSWHDLTNSDKKGLLVNIIGDGTYGTLKVQNWVNTTIEPLPEIVVTPNMG